MNIGVWRNIEGLVTRQNQLLNTVFSDKLCDLTFQTPILQIRRRIEPRICCAAAKSADKHGFVAKEAQRPGVGLIGFAGRSGMLLVIVKQLSGSAFQPIADHLKRVERYVLFAVFNPEDRRLIERDFLCERRLAKRSPLTAHILRQVHPKVRHTNSDDMSRNAHMHNHT